MPDASKQILEKMLERLYAALIQGPCLNSRPHASRQRVDLAAFQAFNHIPPAEILPKLLAGAGKLEMLAKVPSFQSALDEGQLTDAQRAAKRAWESQCRLVTKLKGIVEDAYDYEQETGENALYIGYPLISVPPGSEIMGNSAARIVAPLALIPIDMSIKAGASQATVLSAKGEGIDLVVANFPLLAWLEQQTGQDTSNLFIDEEGSQPYLEINSLAKLLSDALRVTLPADFPVRGTLEPVPRTEQLPEQIAFLNSAVLGLFPVSNQGLLRDTKALLDGEPVSGPLESFLSPSVTTTNPSSPERYEAPRKQMRSFVTERLVCAADPCQTRATILARQSPVLVVHGPPGTGKSQTITNIIGDHLSRGERILMVCDKRTAIDVVQHRLEFLGLGEFCAVVHDAQRDQRNLYMKIRDALENLPERKTNPDSNTQLSAVDDELIKLHNELSTFFSVLSEPQVPGQKSFHTLVGEWFGIAPFPDVKLDASALKDSTISAFEPAQAAISEILERALKVDYPHNPWVEAAGLSLGELLANSAAGYRHQLSSLVQAAGALDQLWTADSLPLGDLPLQVQADAREKIAQLLPKFQNIGSPDARQAWSAKPLEFLKSTLNQLHSLDPALNSIASAPLEPELLAVLAGSIPTPEQVNFRLSTLLEYETIANKWYGSLYNSKKSEARKIAASFGLQISLEVSQRLRAFFEGLKARLLCQNFYQVTLSSTGSGTALLADGDILAAFQSYRELISLLLEVRQLLTPLLQPLVLAAINSNPEPLVAKLIASAQRARTLAEFLATLQNSAMFSSTWLSRQDASWRAGKPAQPVLVELENRFDTLETVLRLQHAFAQLPTHLHAPVLSLMRQSADSASGIALLRKELLAKEISHRIRTTPALQDIDQENIERCFHRYKELEEQKRKLVRDSIIDRWLTLQKSRLLASTGTQLNSAGAALKRRLLTRGERAMKLRQMIHHGTTLEGPDPLFDVCPVWMASPATVAQIFPREPIFDLIVFDEASQCRLEEALPVLLRGKRVVIAGDPKQLPPTRFFESAFIESDPEDAESEQDLFEQQQGETEDLLTAALNIEVRESYLDVHYRSRHESLIGFSNKNFYRDRLQPIPSHPNHRPAIAPIKLIRADGIYENRGNLKEAQIVCDILEQLLSSQTPPSIGVACFNLMQRDLILEALEERCEQNPGLAERVEQARKRRGSSSFEGLFVKNLENVQGDERDHFIISTTFGPESNGKFRRNFGPLGRAGGGRRLNVLVTRAREAIHLITSIPSSEYRVLPELETGQFPGGRWLLYAYLNYAENLERSLQKENELLFNTVINSKPTLRTPEGPVSPLPLHLAQDLARRHGLSCQVAWGNPGFCVDIAITEPTQPAGVTIGVLCDMTTYPNAADPIEWELFRTEVLLRQGWNFHRVWSPSFFADPARQERGIAEASRKALGKPKPTQAPADEIRK